MDLDRVKLLISLLANNEVSNPKNPIMTWANDLRRQFHCDNPIKRQDYLEQLRSAHHLTPKPRLLVPQMFELLRQCLLTQRWKDLADVLGAVVMERNNTQTTISKLSLELFLQDPMRSGSAFKELVTIMRKFKDFYPIQVTLEFFVYMIKTKNLDELQMLCSGGLQGGYKQCPEAPSPEQLLLFNAYVGLVNYTEWFNLFQRRYGAVTDHPPIQWQAGDEGLAIDDELKRFHSLALQGIEPLLTSSDRVWDVFLRPYYQLLDYGREKAKLEAFLRDYSRRHPDNVYAHKLLYEFYLNHEDNEENKITHLIKIYEMSPFSEEVGLEYYEALRSANRPHEHSLPILFKFMDYENRREDAAAWKLLISQLQEIAKDEEKKDGGPEPVTGIDVLNECWEFRSGWWPKFHFANPQRDFQRSKDLALAKCQCAVWLAGSAHPYVKYMLENAEFDPWQRELIQAEIHRSTHVPWAY